MKIARVAKVAVAAVAVAAAALLWWHLHDASEPAPIMATGAAAPAILQPQGPAVPQQLMPVKSPRVPRVAAPASAGASAAEAVVWQLCGMGGLAVSAPIVAAAASAGIDPMAMLPDHLGSAAADAARPALLAALDSGPPRWRAAAVLLRGSSADGEAALPALRELAAASADPVVAMWASDICLRGNACTATDRQRWLDLEPDNLAPWLRALPRDGPGAEALLPGMATAQRFDVHHHALLDVVLQAMPPAVTPYLQWQFWIDAIGVQAAQPLTGLQGLIALCNVPLEDGSTRRAACGAIAHTLIERSDTLMGPYVGLRLAERSGMSQADAKARLAALKSSSATLYQSPFSETSPQPLSCASIERVRTYLQQLATLGEMGVLRAASAPR